MQKQKQRRRHGLDAAGTDKEPEETARYIEELEADIMPVDNLIAFAESEMGAKVFGGEEAAKGVAEHGRQIKAAGENTVTVRHVLLLRRFWRERGNVKIRYFIEKERGLFLYSL